MKRFVITAICVVAGLVWCEIGRAGGANPYAVISARNIFGLVAIEPVLPPPVVEPPLPKLALNGIMTVFGRPQALFKITDPAKPGMKAMESCYVLGEGEREDDVEVVQIDEVNATVTFNNHGTRQQIDMMNSEADVKEAHQ